jgi:hypothetical protein
MKLNKYYSIDECNDEETLFQRLDALQDEGKIEYQKNDNWSIKVTDLDLSTKEEEDLVKFFESLDLYPTDGDDEDDYDAFGDEYDDFEDDYKPRRGGKSYDDNFEDF